MNFIYSTGSLCGKILVRLAVCDTFPDTQWPSLRFAATKEGRPYLASPRLAFDYNITHDGDWVSIVFCARPSLELAPPDRPVLGIDVMEIHLPRFETSVQTFVDTMDMTLTPRERSWILNTPSDVDANAISLPAGTARGLSVSDHARLKRLLTLWTYKEAFTKARGLGLSFDFACIEFAMWDRNHPDVRTILYTRADEKGQRLQDKDRGAQAAASATGECVFSDIVLPSGHAHSGGTRSVPKPGMGTGQGSLLVIAMPRSDAQQRQLTYNAITAQQGEQSGLLRLWTMESLLHAAEERIESTKRVVQALG